MTQQEKIALHTFYKLLGNDIGDMVVPSDEGLTIDGFLTLAQFKAVGEAYEKYLAILRGETEAV